MEFYAIQESVKELLRKKVILGIFMLIKAHVIEESVTRPKIYQLNIQQMLLSEYKMILQELKPYLLMPPDDPSID